MNRFYRIILLPIFLCVFSLYALAQEDSASSRLDEVVVIGKGLIDLAKDRKTPIVSSIVSGDRLREKIGQFDLSASLSYAPSIYIAGQGGGFGNSRISLRGFQQDNISVLLNGQPINDMQNGFVSWDNWAGLSDVMNAVEAQRGLGSSKLSVSSVGGTINLISKTTDKEKGGSASLSGGSDGYLKVKAAYHTGLSKKGWAFGVFISHWQGNGYADGSRGMGQSYFFSLGYTPNARHNFNLLLTASPQWSDRNSQFSLPPIERYLRFGKRYNPSWGIRSEGEYLSERRYFSHKPILNLNWDWEIAPVSRLSTVVYASFANTGGTGPTVPINAQRTSGGIIDWEKIEERNALAAANDKEAPYALYNLVNRNVLYGLVSNYTLRIRPTFTFNAGIDIRGFHGTTFLEIADLLSGAYVKSNNKTRYADHRICTGFDANPWTTLFDYADEKDRYRRDLDQRILHGGIFSQIEYADRHFSIFLQGAFSYQSHQKTDRFNYPQGKDVSPAHTYPGFNVKSGAAYRLNDHHTLFFNIGYYARQPYWVNIFSLQNNNVNPLAKNEDIFSMEAGYRFKSKYIHLDASVYRTEWTNRIIVGRLFTDTTLSRQLLVPTTAGVNELHIGVEIEASIRPAKNIDINGFFSIGDWTYTGKAVVSARDEDLHIKGGERVVDLDGLNVGDAAQLSAGLGVDYLPIDRLRLSGNWRWYDRLYSNVLESKSNVRLPDYSLFDLSIAYKISLGKRQSISFNISVANLLDAFYISDMSTAIAADGKTPAYEGVAVSNRGLVGWGRTYTLTFGYSF